MEFLQLVLMVEYGLWAALGLVGAAMVVWAMVHAVQQSSERFENHTNLTKTTWLLILGGALIFGLGSAALTVFYGGRMGLFGLAAIVAAGVYLAGPKREFELWTH